MITFLAQIEDAQRRLFEKRKFVLRTDYLVPIRHVPRELWPEVLANQKQVEAWRELFAIDPQKHLLNPQGGINDAFLETHPTLVVNTEHFASELKEKLLESFQDLDQATDGILVQAENYQALRFLQPKYGERVRCVYIDPPFNTDNPQFVYKDSYRTSSWVTLMYERLRLAKDFLAPDGTMYVHLDDNSNFYARFLLDLVYGKDALLNEIIWRIGWVSGYKTSADRFVRNHETILAYAPGPQVFFDKEAARIGYRSFNRETIQKQLKEILAAWGVADRDVGQFKVLVRTKEGVVHKIGLETKDGQYNMEDTWNCNEYEELHSNKIKRNAAEYTPNGSALTQKPEQLLERIITVSSEPGDIVFDFFAGSGTTPAVAHKLDRKFIAVEMGNYFKTDMLWRLQQVMYGRGVGIGVSNRVRSGNLGIIKHLTLESYEDALHNSAPEHSSSGADSGRDAALKAAVGEQGYRLRYLVRASLEENDSMLSLERLQTPFDYTIEALTEEGPTTEHVDLVETFNFLYGLHVQGLETWLNEDDRGRRYRVVKGKTRDNRRVLVLWRDMTDLDPAVERRFLEPRIEAEGPFDEKWINGDAAVPGVQSLDGVFKRLLEEGET